MATVLSPSTLLPLGTTRSFRHRLADGARTTVHVAVYERRRVRLRVVALERPEPLAAWCARSGVSDAIVGGFFVTPLGTPLGELRVAGRRRPSTPFDAPWGAIRSCLAVDGDVIRMEPRDALPPAPAGDLLQAGPLLARAGVAALRDGEDAEGFSAGSGQFDSDIAAGRHPRAALGLAGERILTLVCDGRGEDEAGLTLGELARLMLDLGACDAINLDGGGSAALVSEGRLRNRPREASGREIAGGRAIATALAFAPTSAVPAQAPATAGETAATSA